MIWVAAFIVSLALSAVLAVVLTQLGFTVGVAGAAAGGLTASLSRQLREIQQMYMNMVTESLAAELSTPDAVATFFQAGFRVREVVERPPPGLCSKRKTHPGPVVYLDAVEPTGAALPPALQADLVQVALPVKRGGSQASESVPLIAPSV